MRLGKKRLRLNKEMVWKIIILLSSLLLILSALSPLLFIR